MHETMGLRGTDCLWIWGRPYILRGWEPEGLSLFYSFAIVSLPQSLSCELSCIILHVYAQLLICANDPYVRMHTQLGAWSYAMEDLCIQM